MWGLLDTQLDGWVPFEAFAAEFQTGGPLVTRFHKQVLSYMFGTSRRGQSWETLVTQVLMETESTLFMPR